MRDTNFQTQIRLLTLQVENWKKLHDFITYALDKSKPIIAADQERHFTEIRGLLLQESEHVFSQVSLVAEISGKAMNVLQRASSIRGVRDLSAEETRRLESDWNAVFTKIGVVQGQLKIRRRQLLGQNFLTLVARAVVSPQSSLRFPRFRPRTSLLGETLTRYSFCRRCTKVFAQSIRALDGRSTNPLYHEQAHQTRHRCVHQ